MMPEQFWSLTLHEFWIKHAAFIRAENRQRSLVFLLASLTGHYKEKDRKALDQAESALRRYPVKSWLIGS